MKSIFKSFAAAAVMLMACTGLKAECQKRDDGWREKMMSEKIAFFSVEMGLTPEEAQVFWPVYNQIMAEKDSAMKAIFHAFGELQAGLEEGKSDNELKKLTDNYLNAQRKQQEIDDKACEQFRKILSEEKVARLYLSEEKFRRQQIHRFHEKR